MNKKVLIIDDDMEHCRKVKYPLQDGTTDVYYPISVRDALDNFTKQRYCLVIMDLLLRDTDGLALIGTLRSIKRVPILVLSSRTDPEAKAAAYRAGANDYMEKPFDLEECLVKAKSLMQYYLEAGRHRQAVLYACVRDGAADQPTAPSSPSGWKEHSRDTEGV